MNYTPVTGGVCAAAGFQAAGVNAGVKPSSKKRDMMMIVSDVPCTAAAMYTQNKVKGAPILVSQRHLADGHAQAVLCNSGNANTCAPGGEEFAEWACTLAAEAVGLSANDFAVASTGVIGQALPKAPFEAGIPALAKALSREGGSDAAEAIMTTDTVKKEFAFTFTLAGHTCNMGGICKGSGMINPNMATMLSFITTDVAIAQPLLQKALANAVGLTLNQISVDGDTSTNDTIFVLANGLAKNPVIEAEDELYAQFCEVLHALLTAQARALAGDGEGATKLLECRVVGATDDVTARRIAKTIIQSDLFKSAMFGEDANWGRALCAIGYTPGDFSTDNVELTLQSAYGSVTVCQHSTHQPYSEEEAAKVLAEKEILVLVDMHTGNGRGLAWGCDLTYDYVKINGDYRT